MITKVLMPKLSEAMETGKVIQWLKKEGEPVKGGDVIAEDREGHPVAEEGRGAGQGGRRHRGDRDRQGQC